MYSRSVDKDLRRWLVGMLAVGIALVSVLFGAQRPTNSDDAMAWGSPIWVR